MKKIFLLFFILIIIFAISGCKGKTSQTELSPVNSRQEATENISQTDQLTASGSNASDSSSKSVESTQSQGYPVDNSDHIIVPDIYGYGLLDINIFSLYSCEPEFSEGRAVRDTYILSAPSEAVYDISLLFKGRTVNVLRKMKVINNQSEAAEWYLVNIDTEFEWSTTGFVKAEDLRNAAESHDEPGEPWLLKTGEEYHYSASLNDPSKIIGIDEGPVGPFWIEEHDISSGVYKLRDYNNEYIYISDKVDLEPFMGIVDGRVKHGG